VQTAISWSLGDGFENLTISGTAGGVQIQGNDGSNLLIGSAAANYFNGRHGDDTIQAGGGNDTIDLQAFALGNHSLFGEIDGGGGFDVIDVDGYVSSGIEADFTTGFITEPDPEGSIVKFTNIERITGGGFADSMVGNAVANALHGRAGNDTLQGGGGNDTLNGGAGSDSFVFAESGGANSDRVEGFASGSDEVALENAAFTALGAAGDFAAGDGRFWAAAGATAGHDANDRVVYNTSTGNLYYDADGSGAGAAQLIATLAGNPALAAGDITVI
jgi:Ca2+-binding RTX toxin-like protein